ncbi:uv-damaged dna-binding protein [Hirsutella rhossiliensis]|uniref:Uv-damaged dna-binding protein n=1 Tax=Hirsutella rhossiliensis TaxID=111463 RepID=A0A9P8N431_9HYPO|nr:uv-damaged dna-binding protein [Hirsutella rhossiliensis]KAH0966572.1 uv-damaged dna-binding protein [Hirsutella rhossiliensis]
MAIYNAVPPPEELTSGQTPAAQAPPTQGPFDVDAWTVSALQSLSVSPVARGTGTPLAIPIDQHPSPKREKPTVTLPDADGHESPRRPPSRRDSQRRRESVLKGSEGSRQRRRWENDHLVGVPNVQPPLPSDWEVRPTHPIHHTPYQLAQFWDRGIRQRVEDKAAALQATRKRQQRKAGSATGLGVGEVPRDLRELARRSPTIRSWVRALEEPVRQYLVGEQTSSRPPAELADDSAADEMDSEDEEIVFVGRSGAMRELNERRQAGYKRARREIEQETVDSGVVFDSFGEGESAAFKRWLAHSISDYYGLASRSVTLANPACRVVYVGLRQAHQRAAPPLIKLPQPLWEIC